MNMADAKKKVFLVDDDNMFLTMLSDHLDALDRYDISAFATGEACLAKRDVSNSPLQALTLLNDQMFMEAAQAMAKAVHAESPDDDTRLTNTFRRCLTRQPAEDEMKMLRAFIKKERSKNLSEEAQWTALARAVLNFDEAVTHP